jgi:hypothetical protein
MFLKNRKQAQNQMTKEKCLANYEARLMLKSVVIEFSINYEWMSSKKLRAQLLLFEFVFLK